MSGIVTLTAPSYMPALLGSSAPGTSLLSSMRAGNGPARPPTTPEIRPGSPTAAKSPHGQDEASPTQMLTMTKAPLLDLVV